MMRWVIWRNQPAITTPREKEFQLRPPLAPTLRSGQRGNSYYERAAAAGDGRKNQALIDLRRKED
jgi:hypothetical protein